MLTRLTRLVVLVVALTLTLASGVVAADKVTIEYWHGFTGPDRPLMEQLIAKFNETHPDIEVKAQAIPWGTMWQQIPAAVAAGKAPDVAVANEDVITGFIARGAFAELTPDMLATAGIDKNRFYASLWNTGSYKGKDYGVPVHSVALVLYYNTDMFKKAGVDINKAMSSREEFLKAMQKLTIDKNGKHPNEPGFDLNNVEQWGTMLPLPWMGGCIFYSFLLQNGGRLVDDDATKAVFNSPEGVDALQFLVDLIYKYHVSPANVTEDGSIAGFRQGKVATNFNGVWRVNDYLNQEGLNFAVAPIPKVGGKTYATWGGSSHLVIPKARQVDKKRQEAALKFIGWITQPQQNLFWTGAGGLPTQPVVAQDKSFDNSPMKPVFASLGNVFATAGFPWVSQVRGAMDEAVSSAMLGKKSPKQALDDGVKLADQQIADAMKNIR
ncbi:MAG: ABC transporter substrate-binding protein [Firmicutes bacterium]|nr:ABC transporter substrate-binding protein [Bacillota bacterium]MDH7494701.1 ABC transporter substrate-binding protein [Bacillota bacterium]